MHTSQDPQHPFDTSERPIRIACYVPFSVLCMRIVAWRSCSDQLQVWRAVNFCSMHPALQSPCAVVTCAVVSPSAFGTARPPASGATAEPALVFINDLLHL
jgi:hypothetical protein